MLKTKKNLYFGHYDKCPVLAFKKGILDPFNVGADIRTYTF